MHGYIVYSGHVTECVEWSDLAADAHEFIDIVFIRQLFHSDILTRIAILSYLSVWQHPEVFDRIECAVFLFVFIDCMEKVKERGPPGGIPLRIIRDSEMREHPAPKMQICMFKPPVFRAVVSVKDVFLPYLKSRICPDPAISVCVCHQFSGSCRITAHPVYLFAQRLTPELFPRSHHSSVPFPSVTTALLMREICNTRLIISALCLHCLFCHK